MGDRSVGGSPTGDRRTGERRNEERPGDETVAARAILEAHWQPRGYTVPNAHVYPHQWLWDSCFHAVVWAHLGEGDRARAELANALAHQADDGFVPHLVYWNDPDQHAELWGRRWTSCVTQPPMFGHAVAELARLGIDVADLVEPARRGLRFLLDRRVRVGGLVAILHPWESGCDDSPRWDAWYDGGWTKAAGFARKGELVRALRVDAGSPVGSDAFEVGAAGFNALVAFNARELDAVDGGDPAMGAEIDALVGRIDQQWVPALSTWADAVDAVAAGTAEGHGTARVRTVEALLPTLVSGDEGAVDAAFAAVCDERAFGGRCGPAQVHRDEPAYDPGTYWRGPAWPQLTYLLWLAARRRGRTQDEAWLRDALVRGAAVSGFAEYWHPDSGHGMGAIPQSWTTLAAVVTRDVGPVDDRAP
jgi:hypothetical protein